jgi:uncharacterized protein (DUF433 family)
MVDHPRIEIDPDRMTGKPVVRGTRLTVEFVLGLMAEGWDRARILKQYPSLTADDITACIGYPRA